MPRFMPGKLAIRVEINAKSVANELDKALANLTTNGTMEGLLANTATGREGVPLFPFLDKGTHEHPIPLGAGGYLANNADFIVRSGVEHPGTPPHDISARATTFFESSLARRVAGPSTRSLLNRAGTIIDFGIIRQMFQEVLLQTKEYAAQITPSNWHSVKDSYTVRFNKRKIE